MMDARINVSELAKEWLNDPAFKAEYDALEEEFSLAAALIRARCGTLEAGAEKVLEDNGDKAAG